MLKTILVISTLTICTVSFGQDASFRRYFDSSWQQTAKEVAYYYTDFTPKAKLYQCVSYYANSNKLYGVSTFADTAFSKGVGLMRRYFETGELKDSTFFDAQGLPSNQYAFHKNGQIALHISQNFNTGVGRFEAFDENGKPDPKGVVVQVAAQFEGGISAWTQYLVRKLNRDVPVKKGAPPGVYTVRVSFVINEEGKVDKVVAENDPGYGTKEEAERVIMNSPKWIPATQNGKNVVYRHMQSIAFMVSEEKSNKKH